MFSALTNAVFSNGHVQNMANGLRNGHSSVTPPDSLLPIPPMIFGSSFPPFITSLPNNYVQNLMHGLGTVQPPFGLADTQDFGQVLFDSPVQVTGDDKQAGKLHEAPPTALPSDWLSDAAASPDSLPLPVEWNNVLSPSWPFPDSPISFLSDFTDSVDDTTANWQIPTSAPLHGENIVQAMDIAQPTADPATTSVKIEQPSLQNSLLLDEKIKPEINDTLSFSPGALQFAKAILHEYNEQLQKLEFCKAHPDFNIYIQALFKSFTTDVKPQQTCDVPEFSPEIVMEVEEMEPPFDEGCFPGAPNPEYEIYGL